MFEEHKRNLIEWMYFGSPETGLEKDASVLMLGDDAAVGLMTEVLKDRVRHISGRLDDRSYDYILLPALYKKHLKSFEGSWQKMIQVLSSTWLSPGGKLIFIADNKNAVFALAGARPEPERVYVSWQELQELKGGLFETHVLCKSQLYFPLPAADMPLSIYSEQYWPKQDEEEAYIGRLCAEGLFAQLAPAYIFVFQADGTKRLPLEDERSYTPIFVKYNSSRRPEYAIKTMIALDKEGRRYVIKQALSEQANEHILALERRASQLQRSLGPQLQILKPLSLRRPYGQEHFCAYVCYPFLTGRSLASVLADSIREGKPPVREIEESFQLMFGEEQMQTPANLDMLFSNILVTEKGLFVIDCEWVQEAGADTDFLKYRCLKYWYESYKDQLEDSDSQSFFAHFGMDALTLYGFEEQERAFQQLVHGEGEKHNVNAYMEQRPSLIKVEHLQRRERELMNWVEQLKEENKAQEITISKERELNRLTQVHVHNLEGVIAAHEQSIGELQGQLRYALRHQALGARAVQKLKRTLRERYPEGSRQRCLLRHGRDILKHPLRNIPLLLSADGKNRLRGELRIGREYWESGRLHFPYTDEPLVSIIIPCYNQVGYTYRCLRSILNNTDFEQTPYELIIADDVSTDATAELERYADNLIIARNTENQGFLKNCNQAAAKSRAEFLLFLNNDTTVEPDWLGALVRLIRSDASIGMVGSKLVYPDGRLQEAGGIIWSDGSGWNYGRLQDPSLPEFNYVKEVDYISGAAIMIHRDLWLEIGGFDERFAPAYCEDSDLAFEVRARGRRVMYQPRSVVVHYEGISNGTDVNGGGLKRYQRINHEKFVEKWQEALKLQSVDNGSPNPFRARERSQRRPCILVIDHYVPTWDKDAGSKTTFQYLNLLVKKGYQVKFLGDNFLKEEPYTSVLEQMGIEVLYGAKMQAEIWEWLKKNWELIDLVYLNRPHIAVKYMDFIRKHTGLRCVFYGHDLHYLRLLREYELSGEREKLQEAEHWKNIELQVIRQSDMSYYPSQIEVNALHKLEPELKLRAITAYIFEQTVQIGRAHV